LILPNGKDLTEWVEAGNYDLQNLIEKSATELLTISGIPEPIVKTIVGGYEFFWIGMKLKIVVDHIEEDDSTEISVFQNDKPIYVSGFKLLSITHKEALVKALKFINKDIPWAVIVNQVAVQSLIRIRTGEEVIFLDNLHEIKRPEYLIHPLFVKNVPNIIYGDRGSAKSLFMSFVDLLLYLKWENNPFNLTIPSEHKVLILDWENDSDVTKWQVRSLSLGIDVEYFSLAYLHCSRSLVKSLFHIQKKINEIGADTIIMDSLGLAVGGNLNDSEPALSFFSALRQLPVTPLIIAHNAKDINNKYKTVYGNVFYENLSRSIWEVSKYQEPNSNELTLSMYQRKSPPFASYNSPLGFKFVFDEYRTRVSICEPQEDKRGAGNER
jgi:hypothetical protein